MSERHKDIFKPEEAAEYLGLPSKESLRTLEKNYGLLAIEVTTYKLYHREDLDRCVQSMRGIDPVAGRRIEKPLRLAGGSK